jgi:hypothetical protein
MADGSDIALEYQRRRSRIGRSIIERPQYYIDITRPMALLTIQRKYDVRREAVHLASTKSGRIHQEIQEFRSWPGRCLYRGSSEITEEMSEKAEIQELQALDILGVSTDHWLSENVAIVTNRTREGRSLLPNDTNMDWAFMWQHDGLCGKENSSDTIMLGQSVGREILNIEDEYFRLQEMANRPRHLKHPLN